VAVTAAQRPNNEPDTMELPTVAAVSPPGGAAVPRPPHGAPLPTEPPQSTPAVRSRGRDAWCALGVAMVLALLGLPMGAIWALTVPRVELVHVDGGWAFTEENPEQYMAADGVFALMGLGLGIVAGAVVWFVLRRRRGPLVLTGLVAGAIACQTVAWRFGRIGRDAYQASLDTVPIGWHVWRAPELLMVDFAPFGTGEPGKVDTAWEALLAGDLPGMMSHLALGVLATMAFAAAFTYTVCAGWSKFASLRSHEEPQWDDRPAPPMDPAEPANHHASPMMQNLPSSTKPGRLPSLACRRHHLRWGGSGALSAAAHGEPTPDLSRNTVAASPC
jgi:hypothetical protein